MSITIKVPATSANLGSGFDVLGLALNLMATFKVDFSKTYTFINVEERFANPDNLFIQAYTYTCQKEGFEPLPISLSIQSDIPISRGLGSSSSLIVGGITAAFALNHKALDIPKALNYANDIEGHPDNIAPALLGGLISATVSQTGQVTIIQHALHPSLKFTLLIPDFELSTHASRAVLPTSISLATASLNASKCITLLHGLKEGNLSQIAYGCDDLLHQPYRFPLIEDYPLIKNQLTHLKQDCVYLSGAGPSIAIIHKDDFHLDLNTCKAQWHQVSLTLNTQGVTFTHA